MEVFLVIICLLLVFFMVQSTYDGKNNNNVDIFQYFVKAIFFKNWPRYINWVTLYKKNPKTFMRAFVDKEGKLPKTNNL